MSAAAVAAYFGVDHNDSLAGCAQERTAAARMKLLRQRLRDALLLQVHTPNILTDFVYRDALLL